MFVVVTHKSAREPTASPDRETAEDVELVVIDIRAREPGFYMNRTRTYFVARDGAGDLAARGRPPAGLRPRRCCR